MRREQEVPKSGPGQRKLGLKAAADRRRGRISGRSREREDKEQTEVGPRKNGFLERPARLQSPLRRATATASRTHLHCPGPRCSVRARWLLRHQVNTRKPRGAPPPRPPPRRRDLEVRGEPGLPGAVAQAPPGSPCARSRASRLAASQEKLQANSSLARGLAGFYARKEMFSLIMFMGIRNLAAT